MGFYSFWYDFTTYSSIGSCSAGNRITNFLHLVVFRSKVIVRNIKVSTVKGGCNLAEYVIKYESDVFMP